MPWCPAVPVGPPKCQTSNRKVLGTLPLRGGVVSVVAKSYCWLGLSAEVVGRGFAAVLIGDLRKGPGIWGS